VPIDFLASKKIESYSTRYRKDGRISRSALKLQDKGYNRYGERAGRGDYSAYLPLFGLLGVAPWQQFWYPVPGRTDEVSTQPEVCRPPSKDGGQTCTEIPNAPFAMVEFRWFYTAGNITLQQYSDHEILMFNYDYTVCPGDEAACPADSESQ
jgi:hypothetical protein